MEATAMLHQLKNTALSGVVESRYALVGDINGRLAVFEEDRMVLMVVLRNLYIVVFLFGTLSIRPLLLPLFPTLLPHVPLIPRLFLFFLTYPQKQSIRSPPLRPCALPTPPTSTPSGTQLMRGKISS